MPKISVIIPTYNCAAYIADSIDSVLSQTFRDYEIIVIDDGSADNTAEVLKQYSGKIRYFHQDHRGVSSSRNLGIKNSLGEYVAFLDADDMWVADKLRKQVDFINRFSTADAVVCDLLNFDTSGTQERSYFEQIGIKGAEGIVADAFKLILEKNFCLLDNALIKKDCVEGKGKFDEKLIFAEDLDFFLRIAARYKIGIMPEVLTRRRIYNKKTNSLLIPIEERRDCVISILCRLESSFPELINSQDIDLKHAKARLYFEYGYQYFIRDEFIEARLDFKNSILYKFSMKVCMYYLSTFFNKKTINWIRKIKKLLSAPLR